MRLSRSGMTLLEVMVAVAIVGGLLVTLLQSLNLNLDIAGRHKFVTVATLLARDKVHEVTSSMAEGKGTGDTDGGFDKPYEGYNFKVAIEETVYPEISRMVVTVSDGGQHVSLQRFIRSGASMNSATAEAPSGGAPSGGQADGDKSGGDDE